MWAKHANSHHHWERAWVGCGTHAQAPCAIRDAFVYLTHPHRAATCDSRTCRTPKPFCSRSWWPSRTPKGCSKGSRCLYVGNGRHLNSGVLTWSWILLTVLLSFQSYWQHATSWCSLYTKQTSEFPPITHNIALIISTDIIKGCRLVSLGCGNFYWI